LLGRILAETSLLADARRHLVTAVTLEPEITLARLSLARTHEVLGERDETDRMLADPRLVQIAGRVILWRRDTARAAELMATLDDTVLANVGLRAMLEMTL